MLNPDEIERIGNTVESFMAPVTEYLIREIARRITEAGQLTSTAAYEMWRLQKLGVSKSKMEKKLQKLLKVSESQLTTILAQSAKVGYNYDIKSFPQAEAFENNPAIKGIVSMYTNSALSTLDNLTGTTALGFLTYDGLKKTFHPIDDGITKACDIAFAKVSTGAADINTAVREATQGLADRGIVSFNYENGRTTEVSAAVKRNVMSSLGEMQAQISQTNHDELGANGWEISAHFASAPDHEPIQGKQYSDKDYQTLNDSLVRRIGTLNCGHTAHPIILGISEPQYTQAELDRMRTENEKGVIYHGEHFTTYEVTQRQRAYERAIRKAKRKKLISEEQAKVNPKFAKQAEIDRTKLRMLVTEYKDFSNATGLRTQIERTWVAK